MAEMALDCRLFTASATAQAKALFSVQTMPTSGDAPHKRSEMLLPIGI
jgi:hypothetical protein